LSGFLQSANLTKFLASSETPPHSGAESKSNSFSKIILNISSLVCPKNGGLPERRM